MEKNDSCLNFFSETRAFHHSCARPCAPVGGNSGAQGVGSNFNVSLRHKHGTFASIGDLRTTFFLLAQMPNDNALRELTSLPCCQVQKNVVLFATQNGLIADNDS